MPTSTRPIADVARELGLAPEEWLPYGRDKDKVILPALAARREQPDGKLGHHGAGRWPVYLVPGDAEEQRHRAERAGPVLRMLIYPELRRIE